VTEIYDYVWFPLIGNIAVKLNKITVTPFTFMSATGEVKENEMTVAFARNKYRQTETAGVTEVESPYRVILVTLGELNKSLAVLKANQSEKRDYSDDHMNRAFTAIYILQSSLDFEKGADIANSLFQVYEYCRLQVLKAFQRDGDAQLSQACEAIEGILSAWTEIGPKVQGA
jgi:flagellar protein FliS